MIGMKHDFTGFPFELVPFVADISYLFQGVKTYFSDQTVGTYFFGIRFLDPTFHHIKQTKSIKTRWSRPLDFLWLNSSVVSFVADLLIQKNQRRPLFEGKATHGHLRGPLPRNSRHCFCFWMFWGIMVAHKLFILLTVQKSQTTTWDGDKTS